VPIVIALITGVQSHVEQIFGEEQRRDGSPNRLENGKLQFLRTTGGQER
jgi:hypothetical protein